MTICKFVQSIITHSENTLNSINNRSQYVSGIPQVQFTADIKEWVWLHSISCVEIPDILPCELFSVGSLVLVISPNNLNPKLLGLYKIPFLRRLSKANS